MLLGSALTGGVKERQSQRSEEWEGLADEQCCGVAFDKSVTQRTYGYGRLVKHECVNFGFTIFSVDLALKNEAESYSSWWFVMYEWIVDGLSSLFVPFSGEKSAAWPREHGNGVARAAGTDAQRLENSRPAKRNYQR